MTDRYALSVHWEAWTPADLEAGEPSERWTERDREPADLSDVLRALRNCSELSCSPVQRDHCRHVWASGDDGPDYRTGEHRTFSVHISRRDGSYLPHHQMFRIFRLAGFVKEPR